jgi:imidazole glycerol-phosphate synthase subunit HisH
MIVLLDYGMGNLFSVEKKLRQLGVELITSSKRSDVLKAEKLILPGVGHFGKAMEELKRLDLIGPLNEVVMEKRAPVLGICLGMQLMTQGSEEGSSEGLGWFSCKTERMQVSDPYRYKIPHTGWNSVEHSETDPLLHNVPSGSEVYFVHAYGVLEAPDAEVLTTTVYENRFVSALRKEHVIGMQFHPEKSLDVGTDLLRNFIGVTLSPFGSEILTKASEGGLRGRTIPSLK